MNRRCTNYHCKTSLDEYPVECPHGHAFCGDCVIEDGCDECHMDLLRKRADTAWNTPPTKSPSDFHDADWLHELRAEQRDYEYAQLIAREEERRAG